MSGQVNVSEILRALGECIRDSSGQCLDLTMRVGAASRPGGTLTQSAPPQQMPPLQHRPPSNAYPPFYPPAASPMGATPYPLPQPSYSGSIDLSNIKPVNSGSVSLAPTYDGRPTRASKFPVQSICARKLTTFLAPTRDVDPRSASRPYQLSRSRSPSPRMTQAFRDNYNPYREERREEYRRLNPVPYGREREFTPDQRGPPPGSRFTPPSGRGFGGPEERPPMDRRMADENNVEVIPIDAGFVGLIIGRQGETMRRVEADTSTRVQFMTGPENSGPMRQCKITGSQHAREAAKAEIYRIIEENGNAVGPSLTGRAPPPPGRDMGIGNGAGVKQAGTGQPALRDNEEAMKIMVPNRTVGLIIGRGGETIRDLQERSACHVNIVGEEKSVNGLRPVNLIGTPSAAAMAKELIMEIVESDTKSLANQGGMPRDTPGISQLRGADGDKINDRIIVPSEAVGMIIGKGSSPCDHRQGVSNAII